MLNYIVSTCGTSLFTNHISNELRSEFFQHTNKRTWAEIPADVRMRLQAYAKQQKTKLLDSSEAEVRVASAELNSLFAWYAQNKKNSQDIHVLLATDTALGLATAELIEAWLLSQGYTAYIMTASGLNTASFQSFRESLSGLTKDLIDQISEYKVKGYRVVFNLTGGFKALNGYLQTISTIYADQTCYLFEGCNECLIIPKLPLKLDAESVISQHSYTFRRLALDLAVDRHAIVDIPDILLFDIDHQIILSEWGNLLWESHYKELYRKKLLPSISKRVIYAANFENSTKDLDENILLLVNQRIADLAAYAESDCKRPLKSLDPKALQAKLYKDHKMWECDLDAHYRIFMKKEGHLFTLEYVTKALH